MRCDSIRGGQALDGRVSDRALCNPGVLISGGQWRDGGRARHETVRHQCPVTGGDRLRASDAIGRLARCRQGASRWMCVTDGQTQTSRAV
jgi:hypothetical protein